MIQTVTEGRGWRGGRFHRLALRPIPTAGAAADLHGWRCGQFPRLALRPIPTAGAAANSHGWRGGQFPRLARRPIPTAGAVPLGVGCQLHILTVPHTGAAGADVR